MDQGKPFVIAIKRFRALVGGFWKGIASGGTGRDEDASRKGKSSVREDDWTQEDIPNNLEVLKSA